MPLFFLSLHSQVVGVTSFNEWHEGTQIEPSVPKAIDGYVYENFEPLAPDHYLLQTRGWADRFHNVSLLALATIDG
jgi:glycoprotein endo-alpha-1,2-mannosidase